jgi:hypothetical protein
MSRRRRALVAALAQYVGTLGLFGRACVAQFVTGIALAVVGGEGVSWGS